MNPAVDALKSDNYQFRLPLSKSLLEKARFNGYTLHALKGLSDESYSVRMGRSEHYKIGHAQRCLMKSFLRSCDSQRVFDKCHDVIVFELHAQKDQRLAGFVSLKKSVDDDSAFILSKLAVLPHFQGKKLGAYLYDCAEDCAKHAQASKLKLKADHSVKAFYEKKGMHLTHSGQYSSLSDMEKNLDPVTSDHSSLDYLDLSIPSTKLIQATPHKQIG